jgi:hypothetical protein
LPEKHSHRSECSLIKGDLPSGKEVKAFAKANKLKLTQVRGLERQVLNKTDIFVIVANDVPPSVFSRYKNHGKKVIVWKIKDTKESKKEQFLQVINTIEKKVLHLIEELKRQG